MKKIPGINFIFHTIARAGGMERAVVDMICGFAAKGIPVRGIAMRTDISVFPENLRDKIELIRVPAKFPWNLSQRFANWDFENRAASFCKPGWKIISASRVPAPTDMAISGGTHLAHLQKKGKKKPSLTDKMTMAHEVALYSQAKICVAHSQMTRDEIVALNATSPEKVICLFPLANIEKFNLSTRNSRHEIRQKWNVSNKTFVLLFPSNDHVRKGGPLILSALDALDDPDIVLAVASRHPINHPRVINIGYTPEIEKYYAAADASILASRYEPFGLVGVESILCGTPTLLSEFCGAVDALSEPGCIKFKHTTEGLCKAILTAKKRKEEGFLFLDNPDSSIHYPFSIEKHIDALLNLLYR